MIAKDSTRETLLRVTALKILEGNNANLSDQAFSLLAGLLRDGRSPTQAMQAAQTLGASNLTPPQLKEPNFEGDLPLHVVARLSPPPKGEEEEEDDDEGDFLDRVVSLYPGAASKWNRQGQIPLMLALQSGRTWNSGIRRLLEAHPAGIDDLQLPPRLYPILFERVIHANQLSTLYGLIQAKPEIFGLSS